jgi:hypothetical protein
LPRSPSASRVVGITDMSDTDNGFWSKIGSGLRPGLGQMRPGSHTCKLPLRNEIIRT